jgi:hypothetical protein
LTARKYDLNTFDGDRKGTINMQDLTKKVLGFREPADNPEPAHCQRAECTNTGDLSLIEYAGYGPSRGLPAGSRWYCASCSEEFMRKMGKSIRSVEDLDTGEVTIISRMVGSA